MAKPKTTSAPQPDRQNERGALYAPIARFGFAVSARAETPIGERRFLLKLAAADLAVAEIEATHEIFEDAVAKSIVSDGWTIKGRGSRDGLSDFAVDTRLGAVFDFTECLMVDPAQDTELLMRFCVTVCSKKAGDDDPMLQDDPSLIIWQDGDEHSMPQHSKIWVRFACLKFRGRQLNEMSVGDMRKFFDQTKDIADRIKLAILTPYKNAVKSIVVNEPDVGGRSLTMRTVFKIELFTASVADETFPGTYRKILLGAPLSKVSAELAVRRNLTDLKRAFETDATEILPVDDLSFLRGIYLVDLKENYASLVGIANNSLGKGELAASSHDIKSLKAAPSNVIGILSGTMLAAAI